jgi:hypothetical protein
LVVACLLSQAVVSCRGPRQAVESPQPPPQGSGDDILDDAGKLHNLIVDRFFDEVWEGRSMTMPQLASAVARVGKEVFAEGGYEGNVTAADLSGGLEYLQSFERAGVFDFFSRQPQDPNRLFDYLAAEGQITAADAAVLRSGWDSVRRVGFDSKAQPIVRSELGALGDGVATGPVTATLDVMAHSFEYWTSRWQSGPAAADRGWSKPNIMSRRTMGIIVVDTLAMLAAVGFMGPYAIIVAAAASIAFIVLTSGD